MRNTSTKQNEPFIQVWDYILDNDELDINEVLLLSKIISLHETKDGCYMTNDYICNMLRLKNIETASRRINKLEKMGYVELKYIPLPTNPKKTKRFIIPTYQNGLSLKSNRVDLKVNTPLILESTPIDLKVNQPLTLESTLPCLESQAIISVDNIKEIDKIYNNKLENQELPSVEDKFKKAQTKSYLCRELNLTGVQFETIIAGGNLVQYHNQELLNQYQDEIRKYW